MSSLPWRITYYYLRAVEIRTIVYLHRDGKSFIFFSERSRSKVHSKIKKPPPVALHCIAQTMRIPNNAYASFEMYP
jgi:hypothetical protein